MPDDGIDGVFQCKFRQIIDMKIAVGSTNPVKINAVIMAASETWPEVIVTGFDVSSGVDGQPRSDNETMTGAVNRAKACLEKVSDADLGLGLEGGVFTNDLGELWSTVWVAVVDRQGNIFTANGARCRVPEPLSTMIKNGVEMGPAVASVTGKNNVRQKEGMIGVITAGFVDRTEEYAAIAKFALGLWYGRDWNKNLDSRSGRK